LHIPSPAPNKRLYSSLPLRGHETAKWDSSILSFSFLLAGDVPRRLFATAGISCVFFLPKLGISCHTAKQMVWHPAHPCFTNVHTTYHTAHTAPAMKVALLCLVALALAFTVSAKVQEKNPADMQCTGKQTSLALS